MSAKYLLSTLLLCTATASFAQQLGNFEEEFDDTEKPWQEIAVQLPAAPVAADLLEFYISPAATSISSIDPKSLTIASDNVVRFTMVTKTSGGAVNISYQGIRCETYEKKLYAFGQADGSWSRSRKDSWQRIADVGVNRQDAALYKSYFCQNALIAGNAERIINRFRNKRPLDLTKGD